MKLYWKLFVAILLATPTVVLADKRVQVGGDYIDQQFGIMLPDTIGSFFRKEIIQRTDRDGSVTGIAARYKGRWNGHRTEINVSVRRQEGSPKAVF